MLLFRTVPPDRRSYNGFQWNGVGKITRAPDWNPDTRIKRGQGLYAIDGNGNSGYIPIIIGDILQIIVPIGNFVLSSIKDSYRMQAAKVIAEHIIKNDISTFAVFLAYNIQPAIVEAGLKWEKEIPDHLRVNAIKYLDGYCLYQAASFWKGITDKMRKSIFLKLEGEGLYYAGLEWRGITDKMRRQAFNKLDDEWKEKAKYYWKGLL